METKVFNERIKSGYPVYIGYEKINIPHLANYLVNNLLPTMVAHKESCFFWHYKLKDVSCFTEELYQTERDRFSKEKLKCENFDTIWTVDFKLPDGTKMKAEISNEVWFNEEKDHPISPFALVFDAPFADGYMLSKVKFTKAA